MSTTVREEGAIEFDASTLAEQWSLVVAHHRSPTVLGLRRVVTATTAIDLGRTCGAFGEGALDDPQLSRAHARVELGPRGALVVSDLGSANGTWVDGARVGSATLREGSIVRTGPVLFVVQRAPETYPMRRSEKAPAVSWKTVAFVERVRSLLATSPANRPFAIDGAPRAAWWPLLQGLAAERELELVGADDARAAKGAKGVCVVPSGAIAAWGLDARAIYVEDRASRDAGDSALVCATMPRVSERLEDIPWLVRGALGRALAKLPAMDASFAARLLAAEWPEDVEGIERWAEAIARRPERHEKLEWVGEDLSYTGGPRATDERSSVAQPAAQIAAQIAGQTAPVGEASLVLARDGGWFRAGQEPAVDLRTRFALARILRALVRSREQSPDETLSLEALIDAGWPGEKLISDSGSNRVYVAIATLRKLGLRERIERREGGYRLALRANIAIVDDEFEHAEER